MQRIAGFMLLRAKRFRLPILKLFKTREERCDLTADNSDVANELVELLVRIHDTAPAM